MSSTPDDWWRHEDASWRSTGPARRSSQPSPRQGAASRWGAADELAHARSRTRDHAVRVERERRRKGRVGRVDERGVPQFPTQRHPASRTQPVRLTPERRVPQIRDKTARHGGWNMPSLTSRRTSRFGLPRPMAASPLWVFAALAVALLVIVALLLARCGLL